jgi:hypothetical protein
MASLPRAIYKPPVRRSLTVRFFAHNDSGAVDIVSARGVRQGDPLGPLLFALVLQRPLEAVAAAHPDVHPIAYADDRYLIGPGPAVTAAFHTLVQRGAAIGLTPSLHKCAVYGTPSTPAYMASSQRASLISNTPLTGLLPRAPL